MNDPDIARLTNQAISLYRAGQFSEAERYYRKALQLKPSAPELLIGVSCNSPEQARTVKERGASY